MADDGTRAHHARFVAPPPGNSETMDRHCQDRVAVAACRASTAQGLAVFARRGDVAFALSRRLGRSPGSPNALIERALGTQATTRNWNTIERLVAKFG